MESMGDYFREQEAIGDPGNEDYWREQVLIDAWMDDGCPMSIRG